MKAHIDIGGGETLELARGLMLYRGKGRTYCAWHEAVAADRQVPLLGPAKPLTTEFVRGLVGELGVRIPVEVLPASVLVRTEDLLVWWTSPKCRTMFLRDTDVDVAGLSGNRCPQPPLLWAVSENTLRVRALARNERPDATTALFVAPHYNTDGETGVVCQGYMRSPEDHGVAAIGQWERPFFQSAFTHQTGTPKLTLHPDGFVGLWKNVAGSKRFPANYLVAADETLLDFARREARPGE